MDTYAKESMAVSAARRNISASNSLINRDQEKQPDENRVCNYMTGYELSI